MDRELADALLGRPGPAAGTEGAPFFRAIAESLPLAVWVVGPDGQAHYVNGQAVELTGAAAEELAGPGWLEATHPEDRRAILDGMATGAPFAVQHRVRRRDGVYVWHAARARPILAADGTVARWLGASTDVDDERRGREELAVTTARLEARFLQSQRLEAIGRLAGAIAHDFNNLLTAIGGFAHLALRRQEQGVDATNELNEVVTAAERSGVLVRQLLAFTSAERDEVRPLDVNAQLAGLSRLLHAVAGDTVVLELRPAGELPAAVASPSVLGQIVVNLLTNARDALADGGLVIVSTDTAALDAAAARQRGVEPGRYVAVRVEDDGSGMDEATRSLAFEPFFTTKERSRGTGLGLSTVRDLVRRLGGAVELDSSPGAGTTATVLLPVAESASTRLSDPQPATLAAGTETILVVEDVEPVRTFLVDGLTEAGYRVIAADSAEEALAAARDSRVDLLLTDIVMPGLSGTELAERLEAVRPGLRVLLMSGYAEEDLGGREFILKPFDAVALTRQVRAILDDA